MNLTRVIAGLSVIAGALYHGVSYFPDDVCPSCLRPATRSFYFYWHLDEPLHKVILEIRPKNFDLTARRDSSVLQENDVGKTLQATLQTNEINGLPVRKIDPTPELTTYNIKLGWIQGVLIPCLLNIWGVMLFLRISWVVAQAGLGFTTLIIIITSAVCTVTALSLSAICTNGELQGGGVYYIVSRSLGAELGASVGIIFAFANAVAASMNTIGFCESLNDLLKSSNLKIIDNDINDIRIVGAIALLVMCIICAIGMDWESKVQNFLIVIIVVAILNYILGAYSGPMNDSERAKGFVGINVQTTEQNLRPDFRYSEGRHHDFFSVFAIFFPAMTGVQSGANICGDLRDPAKAIPKGTLTALGVSTGSYLVMAWLCGAGALRDATGDVRDVAVGTIDSCRPNCDYGIHHNYGIMQVMAMSSTLIYLGCWAATLSTALTNLLSVPRLIQALGVDRIYPGLIFFSKPYGKHGEPYRGYVLTFFVSLLFLLIGKLNTIAPLITNFYLASYALINFCTFHAGLIEPINWRPTFRYYNTWLSLSGFIMCIVIMMIISWVMALVTLFLFLALYLLVLYRNLDVNWASSTDAQKYKDTITTLVQISRMQENVKAYNPQVLVLAGRAHSRPALLDMGEMITRLGSFMIVVDISEIPMSNSERSSRRQLGEEWLSSRKDRGFFVVMDGYSFEDGVRALILASGLGQLRPNVLLMGYQNKWISFHPSAVETYVRIIQLAYEHHLGVAILRIPETVWSEKDVEQSSSPTHQPENDMRLQTQILEVMHRDSDADSEEGNQENPPKENFEGENYGTLVGLKVSDGATVEDAGLSSSIRNLGEFKPLTFTTDSNLDAWWLYEDGGLNILLPYIIARRGFSKMTFRIFVLAKESQKEVAEERMVAILGKFRLEYSSLTVISGLNDPPQPSTVEFFSTLIQDFKTNQTSDLLITDLELENAQLKTNRYLRLRELLIEHSQMASLIVLTLPLPRKNKVSAARYMCWLEVLSKDLPPVLFVRGNVSVLGV